MGSDERPRDAYIKEAMDRITDAAAVEHRLLELAYTTDAKITVTALAYFAPCSVDLASRVLDDMVAHDRLSMEVEDDGTIAYHLPGRQRITSPHAPAAPVMTALVPAAVPHREASPLAAALLSVLMPGAGHLYAGRIAAAVMWFFLVGIGYALILPGLVLHACSIVSAAAAAHRLNASRPRLLPPGQPFMGAARFS
jgi:TM2 domain-containing membrane protein YozV